MIVTIVHNDTDSVKFQIKEMRQNLDHVKPSIIFKSCCVWDFTESVFEENHYILLMLSKHNRRFAKEFFGALTKHKTLVIERKCYVCVVLEGQESGLGEEYEGLLGKEHVATVGELKDTFTWLPKVCAFLYQNKKIKKRMASKLSNCVIPKINDDAKLNELRESFKESLNDLKVNVSDDFQEDVPRHCIVLRKGCKAFDSKLTEKTDPVAKADGTIIEYNLSPLDTPHVKAPLTVTYETGSLVFFIIHVLYILDVIHVTTVQGERLSTTEKRRDRRKFRSLSSFNFLNHDDTTLGQCRILTICAFSSLNPSLFILFLTPFPYIALILSAVTGKTLYWNRCVTTWILTCTAAMILTIFSASIALDNLEWQLRFFMNVGSIGLGFVAFIQIWYLLLED